MNDHDDELTLVLHHLRQPVMTIALWERVLREHPADAGVHERGLDAIRRCVDEQSRMMNHVLDLSRARRGELLLDLKPVHAEELLGETLTQSVNAAAAARVTVTRDLRHRLGRVVADAGRMRQILRHMILTAVGDTPAGGTVTITGRRIRGAIAICVSDHGDGMIDEAGALTRSIERMLCRRLAELLGGTLAGEAVTSGRGSIWTLTLPSLHSTSTAAI